ncbi:MAG TPA: ATP-dependent zinc metalloprotease FtsH [Nitriliruptorales bacterium]|nr:ATP-dependent zinc metalloprotease FtsH [Nitriliruptorales bacterium]
MSKPPGRRPPYRRGVFWMGLSIPALIVLYAGLMFFTLPRDIGQEAGLKQFFAWAQADQVESAVLLSQDRRVLFVREGGDYWTALPPTEQYMSQFVQVSLNRDIPLEIDQQVIKSLIQPATYLVPALIIVCAFVLIFLLLRAGAANPFLRAAARRGAQERPVTFADVAGADEAVAEIREVRDYLLAPDRLAAIGAEAPRGILLAGPPGTGKTLLARAVAGEAGVPFFSISGTDFVEMYVGVGAARVRDLFRQVRERAPAILFIDELDALGRSRVAGATAGADERDQTLNQLLVELDGFSTAPGVVMIGATNRPDVLDPALLRRGRFDRQIVVDRPDRGGRLAILRVHARNKRLAPDVDLARLAAQTTGFTGADLAGVLNDAALLAARRGKLAITELELEEAVDRALTGSEGRARLLSPEEKRAVAYHEAGHTIVAFACPAAGPVSRVSIVSRGRNLGFTRITPDEEKLVVRRDELDQRLAVTMGGRAAERLVLGQATSGAKDDLRRATALARRMVCELGMSDALGQVALGRPAGGTFLDDGLEPDYSGEVAALIDREIRRIVEEAFVRATDILKAQRLALDELARLLTERETLREADLAPFVDPSRALPPVLSS